MKKTMFPIAVLMAGFAAGAVTNDYYRAELETAGGVARLAGLVKVQKGGDVSVPGRWTVPGGAAAVAFENGRIVVKGKLVFDSDGAAMRRTDGTYSSGS